MAVKFSRYGVDIMMSEEYHNSLCEKAKARCRRIDRAKLKGTGAPMDLFAFDINREAQPQAPDPATHVPPRRGAEIGIREV